MNGHFGRATLVLALACAGGCSVFTSDKGEIQVDTSGEIAVSPPGFTNQGPLLVGTHVCAAMTCVADACTASTDQNALTSCFDIAYSGAGMADDAGCLLVADVGEVDINFTA